MPTRVALVAREVYPFVGGGIAPVVFAAAQQLTRIAEVTLVTSSEHRERHAEMVAAGDPRLPAGVRWVFAEEPTEEERGGWFSFMHVWSARVDAALREAYPERGPDLVEFCDYLAEGFVTIQARHTCDPWLEDTVVAVRLHTTSEMCSVLDGHLPDDFGTQAVHEAERYCLRRADRLLHPGGDVFATYQRYYGADALAPDAVVPYGFLAEDDPSRFPETVPSENEPLQLLYLGRMERRKGVQNLVRAVTRLPRADLKLTLLGGDTKTGPLGGSLRGQLELMAGSDPRIEIYDGVPRDELGAWLAQAHVVVVPSLWECWPGTAREALAFNRPLVATPVGGLVELCRPGRSGWLARDTSAEALTEVIRELASDPEEVVELIRSGGPRARAHEVNDADALVRGYEAVLAAGREAPQPRRRPAPPLVSVVVPYFKLEETVEETVRSALAQTHAEIEVVVVNDGSLREADAGVFDLPDLDPRVRVVTQANSGLGPARNFGIANSFGEYVLPLDADDVIDPRFVERCLHALERDGDLAYVTTWVAYVDEHGRPSQAGRGYEPYGNWSRMIDRNNVAGTCSSVIRRSVFDSGLAYSPDMTSYEDWLLYREMHHAGLHGAVVPEYLFHYRVRGDSMMREIGEPLVMRLYDEMRAHVAERAMRWTAA